MIATTLTLRGAGTPSADVIADVLWAYVRPTDRIEHIRVRAGPGVIAICFFVLCRDQSIADAVVRDVEVRVQGAPILCGWSRA